MGDRRSQVSIFIIIGIVIVVGASLLSFVVLQEPGPELTTLDSAAVQSYVEACMKRSALPLTKKLAENAGSINLNQEFVWYDNVRYRYLCRYVQGFDGCINIMPPKETVEKELALGIKQSVQRCVDFSRFEGQGYVIDTGDLDVDVNIGTRDILVVLNYPVSFSKDDFQLQLNAFQSKLDVPVGMMYDLAVDVINTEINSGLFDQDEWMVNNKVGIVIEKHRPYPDIVYSFSTYVNELNDDLIFNFALQGENTVSKTDEVQVTDKLGCCKKEGYCYDNYLEQNCDLINGEYADVCECDVAISNETGCEDGECNKCDDTYDGSSRKHGESWCSYDSVLMSNVGVGGMSYVGSRHYKHSCVDGVEYVEECRDYREELCTETLEDGKSKALCRPNRWKECYSCEDAECCEDETVRDCYWSEWLDTDRKCHPIIPPGFRFWEGNGADVCFAASQVKQCEGMSCPNKWLDDSALFCYFQGDCGNYRNIADDLTVDGFFSSEPFDYVRDYVYHQPGLNENPSSIGRRQLFLDPYARETSDLILARPKAAEFLPTFISAAMNYLEELEKLDVSDFMNPLADEPNIEILDYSFCLNWQAPYGDDDCGLCEDSYKPCTEYRCRSLGVNCNYFSDKGVGKCIKSNVTDDTPPVISFDDSVLSTGYSAQEAELAVLDRSANGFEVSPKVVPYRLFQFGISTDEPTRCKINYLPQIGFAFSPPLWFGDAEFKTQHNISFRLPKAIVVPEKIYDLLDIDSLTDLVEYFENLIDTYEVFKEKFSVVLGLYKDTTGIDVTEVLDPYVELASTFLDSNIGMIPYLKELARTMLGEFENGSYYLFVKCVDKAGNENIDEMFVKLSLGDGTDDNIPPEILFAEPRTVPFDTANVDFKLYVNEPSTCRYSVQDKDYGLMENELKCPSSPYQTSPVASGSYECVANIPFRNKSAEYYFRCEDNPPRLESTQIKLVQSENFSLSVTETRYLNITGVDRVELSGLNKEFDLDVNTGLFKIDLYIDEPYDCKYTFSVNDSYEEMNHSFADCVTVADVDKGAYLCKAEVEVVFDETEKDMVIACSSNVTNRNVNSESYKVEIVRAKRIFSAGIAPMNKTSSRTPALMVTLSNSILEDGVVCGYNRDNSDNFYSMDAVGDNIYSKRLSLDYGRYIYYVRCDDKYGNVLFKQTEFEVEPAYTTE